MVKPRRFNDHGSRIPATVPFRCGVIPGFKGPSEKAAGGGVILVKVPEMEGTDAFTGDAG
jgi:hypothetical protein